MLAWIGQRLKLKCMNTLGEIDMNEVLNTRDIEENITAERL